ncbi:hypothetical protein BaRGS_00040580 [Batillaria attramentaria]|uniref:Uncharacterized protein n=1 Tax=Batillaria attramentaria TaxID=370345 RepID=A0ABD0IZK1_9CAEN
MFVQHKILGSKVVRGPLHCTVALYVCLSAKDTLASALPCWKDKHVTLGAARANSRQLLRSAARANACMRSSAEESMRGMRGFGEEGKAWDVW